MAARVCNICGEDVNDKQCDMLNHTMKHDKIYTKIWDLLSENFELDENRDI